MDEKAAPLVLESASRHGVSEDDALHAYQFVLTAFEVSEGMQMFIGPSRIGELLEVGVVRWHGVCAIVHAMPARAKYLR